MPASATAHPPIQPTHGPKALAPQVKVVPQSGTARLSSRYANAVNSMGMNATRIAAAVYSPTSRTT